MIKFLSSLLLVLSIVTPATSAIAQEMPAPASEFTVTDASLSYLSGAVVGTTAGVGTSYLLISVLECENICFRGVFAGALGILGGIGAFTLGTSLGIHWYGEYANLEGDYWAAVKGTLAGAGAGIIISLGLAHGLEGTNTAPAFLSIPLLAWAGGVWAYSTSKPDSAAQARTLSSIGLPMVSYTNTNGKQLMLHVVGGQF